MAEATAGFFILWPIGAIIGLIILFAFFALVWRVGAIRQSIRSIEALIAEQNGLLKTIAASASTGPVTL